MGLLDSILGNMMGAGGMAPRSQSSMSPLVKALLMVLAAKGFQHMTSGRQGGPMGSSGGLGGILGGLLGGQGAGGLGAGMPGGLGGLLGGLAAGGGLGALVNQFRDNGYGDHVDSWVGHGANQRMAPDQLFQALGPDTIDELEQQTGMPRDQLLSELSQELPEAVDHFTPEGRLPTEQEVSSRYV